MYSPPRFNNYQLMANFIVSSILSPDYFNQNLKLHVISFSIFQCVFSLKNISTM